MWQQCWPDSAGQRWQRAAEQSFRKRGDRRQARSLVVGNYLHFFCPDGGEGNDRVGELDRQPCEPEMLLPDQLVVLSAVFEDLARSAGTRLRSAVCASACERSREYRAPFLLR